ncbi:MAG: hypothetical protein E7456_01125 [Ruminococcaceae bacterium]|nr:hypothetical protein [Oscillospiraceae bacterium]
MAFDNDRLPGLLHQISRKDEVNEKLRELSISRGPINRQKMNLEIELEQAEKRENELQKGGLSTFFLNLRGKFDQELYDIQDKVRELRRKYNTAVYQLNDIDGCIAEAQNEIGIISKCEKELDEAYTEKFEAIIASEHPEAEQLAKMDEELKLLRFHKSVFKSTADLANKARKNAEYILYYTKSAPQITAADVLFKSEYDLRQERIEAQRYREGLYKMRVDAFNQLVELEMRLEVIPKIVIIYSDINFITSCHAVLSNVHISTYNEKEIAEEMISLCEGLDRVIEIVNNKYKEFRKSFEEKILNIRL